MHCCSQVARHSYKCMFNVQHRWRRHATRPGPPAPECPLRSLHEWLQLWRWVPWPTLGVRICGFFYIGEDRALVMLWVQLGGGCDWEGERAG